MKRHTLLAACMFVAACLMVFGKALGSASDGKPHQRASERARAAQRGVVQAAGRGNPYINLDDGIEIAASYDGAAGMLSVLKQNAAEPRALASADFDEDGVPDLICGYAHEGGGLVTLYRGNVDSIYPNSPEAQRRKSEGALTDSAFLSQARVFEAPAACDFVGAGDFDADGHWDVVIAARGSKDLWMLPGDGKGSFLAPRKIELSGAVTSLITGEINRADGLTDIVVGVVAGDGPKALVFEGPEGALKASPEVFSLPGEPRALALGQFDDGYPMDLAVGAGSELVIIHGRDRKQSLDEAMRAGAPQARVDRRPLGFEIRSIAAGDFTGTHETSLALLARDGTVFLARARALESYHELLKKGNPYDVQSMGRWQGARQLVRARVSGGPVDNLLLLNDETDELQILQTGVSGVVAPSLSPAVRVVTSLETASKPLAALPMRINADALSDLVIFQAGRSGPAVLKTRAPVTFTVINTTDGGTGSLRQAILDANANPGSDVIAFNIPGAGAHTITPGTALPDVTESVTIDGTTQPGFVGFPLIELDGSSTMFVNGLTLLASNCVIRGMVVGRFGTGLACSSDGNKIEGNFIGTDVTGTGKSGNTSEGVLVGGSNNTIGGTATAAYNLISGNNNRGISIGAGTLNQVQGNFIGTDVTGLVVLDNGFQGVVVGSAANIIGGATPGSRNVISGNQVRGVEISSAGTGNLVQGNLIGTDVTGAAIMPLSSQEGLVVFFGAADNTIGGTTPAARNIISGNVPGVILGVLSSGNRVQGNFIGTDITGTLPLPNRFDGIEINGANNTVGGAIPGARNIISGNSGNGVFIFASEATGNQLQGNFIGTAVDGASKLENTENGVAILTPNNVIGGTTAGARNVISGNRQNGIAIQGNSGSFGDIIPGAPGNLIVGNFLGTDVTGNAKLGNGFSGVQLFTPNNIIGGTTVESQNVLSGNSVGVTIIGDLAQGNQILGNLIGTDATGLFALGNVADGIELLASNNIIGGTTPGTRNVISGNDNNGILIAGANAIASSTSGNVVQGNFIGTDSSGTLPLGNGRAGVFILAIHNLVGGNASSASNRIAFNRGAGINVTNFNGSATGNILSRNSIFSNGGLGIDLGPPSSVGFSDGVTLNDPCDADAGPNNLQNYPLLLAAASAGFSTTVQGTLNSTPNTTFTIEFFANAACDASGNGEGQTFIGSRLVTTGTNCGANFSVAFPVGVPVAAFITATATDPAGNTSEFSQCVPVMAAFDLCLQDESNGNILLVNSTTGEYQFTNCRGLTLTGIGSLVTKGCLVTLQVNGPDRRILARIDTCLKSGTASVQVLSQGTTFTILDRNTANNTCVCTGPG